VENVGECPCHCNREEWQTQEHVVNERDYQYVCDPHAFTVEVCRVGVGITVCDSDVHCKCLYTTEITQWQRIVINSLKTQTCTDTHVKTLRILINTVRKFVLKISFCCLVNLCCIIQSRSVLHTITIVFSTYTVYNFHSSHFLLQALIPFLFTGLTF